MMKSVLFIVMCLITIIKFNAVCYDKTFCGWLVKEKIFDCLTIKQGIQCFIILTHNSITIFPYETRCGIIASQLFLKGDNYENVRKDGECPQSGGAHPLTLTASQKRRSSKLLEVIKIGYGY